VAVWRLAAYHSTISQY